MPEPTRQALALCASSDLQEGGDAVTFDVIEFGRQVQAFALRFDTVAVAYLNRCAHVPAEMDWQPGKFWDLGKRLARLGHRVQHDGLVIGLAVGRMAQVGRHRRSAQVQQPLGVSVQGDHLA